VLDVSANATTVDTFSGTIKEVVDSGRMVELPLNGRNALQLQALLPGSIQLGTGSAASGIALNTTVGHCARKRGHPQACTGWYSFVVSSIKSTTCHFVSA